MTSMAMPMHRRAQILSVVNTGVLSRCARARHARSAREGPRARRLPQIRRGIGVLQGEGHEQDPQYYGLPPNVADRETPFGGLLPDLRWTCKKTLSVPGRGPRLVPFGAELARQKCRALPRGSQSPLVLSSSLGASLSDQFVGKGHAWRDGAGPSGTPSPIATSYPASQ